MKKIKLIIAALMVLGPLSANADVITVTGTGATDGEWNVTLVTDTFDNLASLLANQVWWEDSSLAMAFAEAFGISFVNPPSHPTYGPYFAYSTDERSGCVFVFRGRCYGYYQVDDVEFGTTFIGQGFLGDTDMDNVRVYATATRVASQVPEPGTLALLGLGLAGLGLSRRRKIV